MLCQQGLGDSLPVGRTELNSFVSACLVSLSTRNARLLGASQTLLAAAFTWGRGGTASPRSCQSLRHARLAARRAQERRRHAPVHKLCTVSPSPVQRVPDHVGALA